MRIQKDATSGLELQDVEAELTFSITSTFFYQKFTGSLLFYTTLTSYSHSLDTPYAPSLNSANIIRCHKSVQTTPLLFLIQNHTPDVKKAAVAAATAVTCIVSHDVILQVCTIFFIFACSHDLSEPQTLSQTTCPHYQTSLSTSTTPHLSCQHCS